MKVPHVPYRLGITGTVGSGKSRVGEILKQAGADVLDTDTVVHRLYETDTALKEALVQTFGPEIIDEAGQLSRPRLREKVLNHPQGKAQLEALVHPKVGEQVVAFLNDPNNPRPLRAVLVPLLFEANLAHRFDEVWCVVVHPIETLVSRLMARDQITEDEANRRLALQWTQAEKARHAHRVIENGGTPEDTEAQVQDALNHLGDLP